MRALSLATIGPPLREIQLVAAHDHCSTQKKSKSEKKQLPIQLAAERVISNRVLKGGWEIKKAKRKGASQHCTGSPGQAVAPNIERRPRQTSEWVIFGVCVLGERTSSSCRPGIGDCGCCS